MKYIGELVEGEKIESVFAVSEKQLRTTRAGKSFISMKLMDKTGSADAVVWDNAEATALKFEKGDFVGVRAEVGIYNGNKQLTIQQLKKVEKTPEYVTRFLPVTDRDVDVLAEELTGFAVSIQSDGIRRLIEGFLTDPEFMGLFKTSSAAKGMHHVFAGGLIQHTLKVVRLCDLIYREYEITDPMISCMIDRDILIAGAILHDMGKIVELSREPGFDYTTKGRLLGHVVIGLMELKKRLDTTEGIPEERADLLMHLIISHHGEYEYGSPKRPKSMEAFILHYADNLDAKLQGIAEFAGKDATEGDFTAFHRLYDRCFYKGRSLDTEGEDGPQT